MEPELGYMNWLAALIVLFGGVPVIVIVVGILLRATKLRTFGRSLLLGGISAYTGAATATFTSIGGAFLTNSFHLWDFPEDDVPVSTAMYLTALSILIIVPLLGLIVGGVLGVVVARRTNSN